MSIGAELDIHAAIGKIGDGLAGLHRRLDDLEYNLQERYVWLSGGVTLSTSALTTLVIGSVPPGRVYDLRMVSIAPNPMTTNITVDLFLLTGPPVASGVTPPGSMFRDALIGSTIPVAWGPEGRGNFPIRGGDYIYIVFDTASAAVDVQVNAVAGSQPDQ